jgi:AmmeMemoRadiSam system protein B
MPQTFLSFAGIAPHPPIMIPEVGRDAIPQVRGSIDAMREFTKRIISAGAQTVVCISPHAPLEETCFVAYDEPVLYGDFSRFRAPEAKVAVPLDDQLLQLIAASAARQGYSIVSIQNYTLDHGTAVPLYFLQRYGWQGKFVALGYSFLTDEDHLRFGSCIRDAVDQVGYTVALVASGDLSHRLTPDAPAGYVPDAYLFDDEVIKAIREGVPERIARIDPHLRRRAGECGFRSILVAIGAVRDLPFNSEVLHYEAPFGVGYLVAQLTRGAPILYPGEQE